jgi:hypothetical protein
MDRHYLENTLLKNEESSEKLLYALLITLISENDYRDFETFPEISRFSLDNCMETDKILRFN